MELEIQNAISPTVLYLISAKLYKDIGYHDGIIHAVTSFGSRTSFQLLWHFKI